MQTSDTDFGTSTEHLMSKSDVRIFPLVRQLSSRFRRSAVKLPTEAQ